MIKTRQEAIRVSREVIDLETRLAFGNNDLTKLSDAALEQYNDTVDKLSTLILTVQGERLSAQGDNK